MAWVKVEASRLRVPAHVETKSRDDEAARVGLDERRRRVLDNYEDGLTSKADRDAKLAAIETERHTLNSAARLIAVPVIDWQGEPKQLNDVLRALWVELELDASLRPVRAEWTVPEWRAAE